VSTIPAAGRKVARPVVQLLLARTVFLASGMVVSIILARALGPVEFGIYGVIISVLTWTQLLLNGGIPGATAKLLAERPERAAAIEQTARAVLIAGGLVLFAAGWLAAPTLARLLGLPAATNVLRVALLDLPLMAAYFAWQGALYGHARFGVLALSLVVHTLLKLVGIVLLAFAGLSVTGAVLAQVAASVGVLVYLFAVVPPPRTLPTFELARPMVIMALPLSLYAMALQIHVNLGLWLLSAVGTAGDARGFFVAALNVSRTLSVVQAVLSGVVFASMSRALAQRQEAAARRHLEDGARFALLLIAPAAALLSVDADRVVTLLFGADYAPAGDILRWQLVAFALLPLLDLCFMALAADGRPALPAWLLAALIAPAMVLCLALVNRHGGAGAAAAQAIVVAIATALAALAAWRRFRTLVPPLTLLRVGGATALTALLSAQISITGPWLVVKLAALAALWLIVLVLLRELTLADLKAFAIWKRGAA
jgi:O-antigen/teichoic acid export membrane protein